MKTYCNFENSHRTINRVDVNLLIYFDKALEKYVTWMPIHNYDTPRQFTTIITYV